MVGWVKVMVGSSQRLRLVTLETYNTGKDGRRRRCYDQRKATGLSQAMEGLMNVLTSDITATVALEGNLLREFIEAEILEHFDLIQGIREEPGEQQAAQLAIVAPQSWADI